jgi:hypothetical protein
MLKIRVPICKLVFKFLKWLCVVNLTHPNHLMAIVLGMCYKRYINMPLLMKRWLTSYIVHQSNLPKLKSTNVSNGQRNLARVSNVGEGVCGL